MEEVSYYGGPERRLVCPFPSCGKPEEAAKQAVKDTFNILGVNVDDPKQVEDFRKGLRFGEDLLQMSKKGKITIMCAVIGLAATYIWNLLVKG
jgi:hypothetical protein